MNRQKHQGIKQEMGFRRSPSAIVLIFCFLQGFLLTGQTYTVKLIVTDCTEKDEIFIAGSFNNWETGDPRYKLESLSWGELLVKSTEGVGTDFEIVCQLVRLERQ